MTHMFKLNKKGDNKKGDQSCNNKFCEYTSFSDLRCGLKGGSVEAISKSDCCSIMSWREAMKAKARGDM